MFAFYSDLCEKLAVALLQLATA